MVSDKEKLERFIKNQNLNQSKLAQIINVKQQVISRLLTSKNSEDKATPALKYALLKYFDYDIDTGTYVTKTKVNQGENVIPIHFFKDAKAAAGIGEMLPESSEEEVLYFDKRWLENIIGVKPNNAIIIQAEGNSMYPNIQNGDLLIVDTSIKNVINNKIFVIQQGNDLRVKRLVKEFTGEVYLISDNDKEYPPERAKQDSNIVGRVVWNGSKENV